VAASKDEALPPGEPHMEEQARDQDTAKGTQESAQRRMQEAMRARMEKQTRGQDPATRAQDTARPSMRESERTSADFARVGMETTSLCTQMNRAVWRGLIDVTSKAARESVRLTVELQQLGLGACSDLRSASVRWATLWPAAFQDPLGSYVHAVEQSMETARRSLEVTWRSSQALTRSLQEMGHSLEEASRGVQQAFKDDASRP
jgi:hypothetical protein